MNPKELIAKGKLKQAIDQLETEFKSKGISLDKITLIKSEMSELKDELFRGTIDTDKAEVKKARIKNKILSLINHHNISQRSNFTKEEYSTKRKDDTRVKSIYNIGGILFFTLLLILGYQYFQKKNDSTPNNYYEGYEDDKIAELAQEKFPSIYLEYRDFYLYNQKKGLSVPKLRLKCQKLISQLTQYKDGQLELHSIIYKQMCIALCNKILALTATKKENQLKYSILMKNHLDLVENCFNGISQIEDDEYQKELNQWLDDEDHRIRLKVNKFISSAIQLKAGGPISREAVKLQLMNLEDEGTLSLFRYDSYPIIIWAKNELN